MNFPFSKRLRETPAAIQKLEHLLGPWLAAGHYAVAEQAYAELTKAAPESQQRQVRLAAISIWVRQAGDSAKRLATAGAHALRVHEYAPATVKRAVAGNGAATKNQVQAMVRMLCKLARAPRLDASDALAVAICHAFRGAISARRVSP